MSVLAYKKQSLMAGWTRIDLLLYLYDRAITSLEACEIAHNEKDVAAYGKHFVNLSKTILALHAGLKPEDEVAFNVARLLHFVSESLVRMDFQAAIKVLESLRSGFAAVADEVNELERAGSIPAFPDEDTYRV